MSNQNVNKAAQQADLTKINSLPGLLESQNKPIGSQGDSFENKPVKLWETMGKMWNSQPMTEEEKKVLKVMRDDHRSAVLSLTHIVNDQT